MTLATENSKNQLEEARVLEAHKKRGWIKRIEYTKDPGDYTVFYSKKFYNWVFKTPFKTISEEKMRKKLKLLSDYLRAQAEDQPDPKTNKLLRKHYKILVMLTMVYRRSNRSNRKKIRQKIKTYDFLLKPDKIKPIINDGKRIFFNPKKSEIINAERDPKNHLGKAAKPTGQNNETRK